MVIIFPLMVLGFLAVVGGYIGMPKLIGILLGVFRITSNIGLSRSSNSPTSTAQAYAHAGASSIAMPWSGG